MPAKEFPDLGRWNTVDLESLLKLIASASQESQASTREPVSL
jgi:hypothetical protein